MQCFCINCNRHVEYDVSTQTVTHEVRGVRFKYVESAAICKECGQEVYSSIINDRNVEARLTAYLIAAERKDELGGKS